MTEPQIMAISEFKAKCLAVLERVRRTGQRVVVTRRGEPVAEIVPPTPPAPPAGWLGDLREHGRIVGDIISPVVEEADWEALSLPEAGGKGRRPRREDKRLGG